ncbi:MAG: TatD family hydrolase [Hyphomicrobiales bacterium]|jgi:TatD DNase family protein|nr:TatD family hydrolase [Hyphomicrobiales bacterium]
MLVDTHCHLDYPDLFAQIDAVVARAETAGVDRLVTISTHVARHARYRELAERFPNVFWTIGTHPHNAAEEPDTTVDEIVALSHHPKCVAIGEAGLDYHYDKSPRDIQRRVFRTQIEAARDSCLPLVIHARDADLEMIDILTQEHAKGAFSAILHCFSSGAELARVGIELGFYLSFSGIITFKRSDELRAIATAAPLDRLLVETDAPYLAPEPYRGKTNEPAFVTKTAEVLASARGLAPDELAALTTANAVRVFPRMAAFTQSAAAA